MASPESILSSISQALESLNKAAAEIAAIPIEPLKENVSFIGRAVGNISQLQRAIYNQFPELEPPPTDIEPDADPTPEQQKLIEKLSNSELEQVQSQILTHCTKHWRKVAMVVAQTMSENKQLKGIPDIFYSHQIRLLVEAGKLESQGNLSRMRSSEVRLPTAT